MQVASTAESGHAEARVGHRAWVRMCHWVGALGFIVLCISGVMIFAVHPRLYWGEVGNDLTPALMEIPITANHQPEGWQRTLTFPEATGGTFSANRTYDIFNRNGFARSLHFLAAWFLVIVGITYWLLGFASGHVRRHLWPRARDFSPRVIAEDITHHAPGRLGASGGGPPYGVLQRLSYWLVVFIALPLMVVTGLTMAPTVTAAFPFLLDLFGGYQSARTVHFFSFAVLLAFLLVHLLMVFTTGAGRQLRAMIRGR